MPPSAPEEAVPPAAVPAAEEAAVPPPAPTSGEAAPQPPATLMEGIPVLRNYAGRLDFAAIQAAANVLTEEYNWRWSVIRGDTLRTGPA